MDGELVAFYSAENPSFSIIQNYAASGATFVFFPFELLQHEGQDLPRKALGGTALTTPHLVTTE